MHLARRTHAGREEQADMSGRQLTSDVPRRQPPATPRDTVVSLGPYFWLGPLVSLAKSALAARPACVLSLCLPSLAHSVRAFTRPLARSAHTHSAYTRSSAHTTLVS